LNAFYVVVLFCVKVCKYV